MTVHKKAMPMRAEVTYNAAADHFDAEPLEFWTRHGAKTVDTVGLTRGARVLDVGSGTGSSALPAAQRVGPEGHVLGIDIAKNMVDRASAKAKARGLVNVQFICSDIESMPLDGETFDAVISVFSIFFFDDMEGQIARLWSLLAPGGKLALTFWDRNMLAPINEIFREEVGRLRPAAPLPPKPWQKLTDRTVCRRMLTDIGIDDVTFYQMPDRQQLLSPRDGWTIALGSGLRWEIEQLSDFERTVVRNRLTTRLRTQNVAAANTDAIIAIMQKRLE